MRFLLRVDGSFCQLLQKGLPKDRGPCGPAILYHRSAKMWCQEPVGHFLAFEILSKMNIELKYQKTISMLLFFKSASVLTVYCLQEEVSIVTLNSFIL